MTEADADLQLRCFKVHAPAQAALREVLGKIQSDEMDVFYAIRSRVKSVKKVIEKTIRKRETGKPAYAPEDITDVVGIRVVTLFREDVIEALRVFLRLITHDGVYSAMSPFVKGELKEKIIYTNASVGDPEAITSRLRTVFESFAFPLKDNEIMQVETGYSSIHLIAFCSIRHDGEVSKVPIEIQIRTVFEDAWGEIDHKLRYSLNRNKIVSNDVLESWQPHLNVLKSFTDGCAQYAGIIKNQAIDARPRPEVDPFLPVDNVEEALKHVGDASAEFIGALKAAYDKRADAMKLARTIGQSASPTVDAFLSAADLFSSAKELVVRGSFASDRQFDAADFFSTMERAFCLLSTGRKAALDEAIKIYSEAQEKSPSSVVVYYRYAQALTDLGEYDAALAKYTKAEALLSLDAFLPPEHWLHVLIPRNLGYVTWRKSLLFADDSEKKSERLQLLLDAYVHTTRATLLSEKLEPDNKVRQARNANNALYYAVEYMALLDGQVEESKIAIGDVETCLQILERHVDLAAASRRELNWIDTLCRAYALFGDEGKAVLAAERIEHLLSSPQSSTSEGADEMPGDKNAVRSYYATTSNLNQRERDMLDYALWILRKHGPGPEREGTTAA